MPPHSKQKQPQPGQAANNNTNRRSKNAAAAAASSSAAKQTSSHLDAPQEEPLAAVILADSFDQHFSPLTIDTPRCLLPLCNVSLLHWALEAVCTAGVSQVLILARSHVASLRSHLAHLASHTHNPTMADVVAATPIHVIATPEARSTGDALRELDAKQLLRSDFFLVQPDAVCNLDLAAVAREHRARRSTDKDAIMTICAMAVAPGSRTRSPSDLPLHVLNPHTGRLLHYDNLAPTDASPRRAGGKTASLLPVETLRFSEKDEAEEEQLEARFDLVEAGVDVCSVDVPALFSENFDYEHLRRDFVTGILTSDLLDSKIYLRIFSAASSSRQALAGTGAGVGPELGVVGRTYCARAHDPRSYDAVSRDVVGGWCYPLQPGQTAWLEPGRRYDVKSRARYFGRDVDVASTAVIGQTTMLGARSIVEAEARVRDSVVGADVRIGARSSVRGSYLFEGVRVGRGCRLDRCIVGQGATILEGVRLGRGTLVGGGCVVGPDVELPAFSRVGSKRVEEVEGTSVGEEEDDDDEEKWASLGGSAHGESKAAEAAQLRKGIRAGSAAPGATAGERGAAQPYSSDERLGKGARGFLWPNLVTRDSDGSGAGDADASEGEGSDEDEARLQSRPPLCGMLGVTEADVARHLASLGLGSEAEEDEDVSTIDGDSEFDSDSDGGADSLSAISSAPSAFGGGGGGGGANANLTLDADAQTSADRAAARRRLDEFRAEAVASLSRAFAESHSVDDVTIELKTLRMSSDVALAEVRRTAVEFVLDRCDPAKPREVASILDRWGPLIRNLATDDEQEAVLFLQRYCATHRSHTSLFVPLLKKFYNDDVVSDEGVVAWWRSAASRDASAVHGGEAALELRKKAEEVVRFVLESGDEDDEDEDEEDDE